LIAVLAAGAATGAATAADTNKPAKAPNTCFQTRDILGWKFNDKTERMTVRVNQKAYYTVEVVGSCPGADSGFSGGFQKDPSSNGFICEGDGAHFVSRVGGGPERCLLRNFHRLSPDEVAAIPKGDRP
jgi:hypothetical protein